MHSYVNKKFGFLYVTSFLKTHEAPNFHSVAAFQSYKSQVSSLMTTELFCFICAKNLTLKIILPWPYKHVLLHTLSSVSLFSLSK